MHYSLIHWAVAVGILLVGIVLLGAMLRRCLSTKKRLPLSPLSDREFDQMVRQALDSIPPQFQPYTENVVVDVEDMPSQEVLRSLGMPNPRTVVGYYHGTPLTQRSAEHTVRLPDHIIIYKQNIARICHSTKEVAEQVRARVLHIVGHHFGLSDDDLRELGY